MKWSARELDLIEGFRKRMDKDPEAFLKAYANSLDILADCTDSVARPYSKIALSLTYLLGLNFIVHYKLDYNFTELKIYLGKHYFFRIITDTRFNNTPELRDFLKKHFSKLGLPDHILNSLIDNCGVI